MAQQCLHKALHLPEGLIFCCRNRQKPVHVSFAWFHYNLASFYGLSFGACLSICTQAFLQRGPLCGNHPLWIGRCICNPESLGCFIYQGRGTNRKAQCRFWRHVEMVGMFLGCFVPPKPEIGRSSTGTQICRNQWRHWIWHGQLEMWVSFKPPIRSLASCCSTRWSDSASPFNGDECDESWML